MLLSISRGFRRIADDLAHLRHIDAYIVMAIGIALLVVDILGGAISTDAYLGVMTAALVTLVFRSIRSEAPPMDLEAVLLDRDDYGKFDHFIDGARELWVYGPSSISVTGQAASIKQRVLEQGGSVRMLVQDPDEAAAIDYLGRQLDTDNDFVGDLTHTLSTLARMRAWGNVEVRLLAASPGFSLIIINPGRADGRLTVELHGYQSATINDRMHVVVNKSDSDYWFRYWVSQYEHMWQAAREMP